MNPDREEDESEVLDLYQPPPPPPRACICVSPAAPTLLSSVVSLTIAVKRRAEGGGGHRPHIRRFRQEPESNGIAGHCVADVLPALFHS